MITAVHTLIYSDDAPATRAFFRDVLGWPFVEHAGVGPGWLIFQTGPSELGVHPTSGTHGGKEWTPPRQHSVSLMCDDIEATRRSSRARAPSSPVASTTSATARCSMLQVPGADDIQLYEPEPPDGVRPLTPPWPCPPGPMSSARATVSPHVQTVEGDHHDPLHCLSPTATSCSSTAPRFMSRAWSRRRSPTRGSCSYRAPSSGSATPVRIERTGGMPSTGALGSDHAQGRIEEVVVLERIVLTWQPDSWDDASLWSRSHGVEAGAAGPACRPTSRTSPSRSAATRCRRTGKPRWTGWSRRLPRLANVETARRRTPPNPRRNRT